MCFSSSKVSSRESKQYFKRIYHQRIKYSDSRALSQFLICTLQYMERILQQKVGIVVSQEKRFIRCLPCLMYETQYRNVRKEFQESFQSCRSQEQLQFYRRFVNALVGQEIQPLKLQRTAKNESQISYEDSFNVEVKGKFTWSKGYTMTVLQDRYCLLLKSQDQRETLLNLKNYILRNSKDMKSNSYVLTAIVPIQPNIMRFALVNQARSIIDISDKIAKVYWKALEENVISWKKPIKPVENSRFSQISENKNPKNKQDLFRNQIFQDKTIKKRDSILEVADNKLLKLLSKTKVGSIHLIEDDKNMKKTQSNQRQTSLVIENTKKQDASWKLKVIPVPELKEEDILLDTSKGKQIQKPRKDDTIKQLPVLVLKKKESPKSVDVIHVENNTPTMKKKHTLQPYENYALRPEDTRSESATHHLPQFNRPKQEDLSLIDSGKSLVGYQNKPTIAEEDEQFGNISELSNSFITVAEPVPI